ncbi:uncharacterized protein LOC127160358 isoform X2 [Labeo rohita]|uniref:uncharacterized protein LOC127160358 isoform X2 n=1 Tax=Labeo rohita TaxID=84645 RepID=UPI0021E25051|nr:uncharacterized protein LOC127160358 isoform X2 [Labeo rohita]
MELLVFIVFQLLMEVQSDTPDRVSVLQISYCTRISGCHKRVQLCADQQISIWSGDQSSSVTITCYYTVMKRQAQKPSAHSDPMTVTVQISTATSFGETLTSTKTNISFKVLVSTGVAVILSGLICLCWFASKKRRKHNKMRSIKPDVPSQEIGMSCSGPAETYALITSVPATSQPICGGPEHPESHQDNTTDPTDTNSFIMSVNSIYQPSDVLVNKQQEQGNIEENENVYHLYCTIPDKPVHSNAEDQVYSLLEMHR